MANTYIRYPATGVPTYPTFSDFPPSSYNGALALALDTDFLYAYNTGSSSWVVIAGASSVLSVGTIDSVAASANGAVINLNELVMQSASATVPGLVNLTTQSFAGNKTFTGTIGASNLSGTNTGDVTIGTANGLSLVGQALSLGTSSGSTTGALTSADWTTFNNKQGAGNYITDLTGDATATGPGSAALTLATVNGNVGSFGTADSVSTITVNAKGLITAASNTSIQIAESQVTNLVSDLAGKQPTGNYITALTGDVAATGPGSVAATIQPGVIDNAKVSASAGIVYSKLFLTNSIVNADISSSAAIAFNKLAALPDAQILVGNVANQATAVAVTGDISITNAGTTSYVGTVPISLGGTGQTAKAAAFNALSPMTTGGDIIYGGASGTGTRLANGSVGQVLTSGGGTAAPTWATPSNGLVLLQTQTASNSATIDFTSGLTSTYDQYIFIVSNVVPQTDATDFWIRVSEDGGSSYITTSSYAYNFIYSAGAAAPSAAGSSGSDTKIVAIGGLGNSTGEVFNCEFKLYTPSSSKYKLMKWAGSMHSATPALVTFDGGSSYFGSTNAINAIRFMMSSGNISTGTFSLYGVLK